MFSDISQLAQISIFIDVLYPRSEEHTSELQSQSNLVCRLLLEKKKINRQQAGRPCAEGLTNQSGPDLRDANADDDDAVTSGRDAPVHHSHTTHTDRPDVVARC